MPSASTGVTHVRAKFHPTGSESTTPFASDRAAPSFGRSSAAAPTLGSDETREFARAVRASRWQTAIPAIVTALFGGALFYVAAAAPPTRDVARLLTPAEPSQELAAVAEQPVDAGYELPDHWEWPSLPGAPASDARLACDPRVAGNAC
jgi:hypothetical protein